MTPESVRKLLELLSETTPGEWSWKTTGIETISAYDDNFNRSPAFIEHYRHVDLDNPTPENRRYREFLETYIIANMYFICTAKNNLKPILESWLSMHEELERVKKEREL